MKKVYLIITGLALIAAFALILRTTQQDAGNTTATSVPSKKITIVSTIYPFTDMAKSIVKDRANVVSIVPGGVEPHDYEPTPQDVIAIQNSDIFVFNGMSAIESWLPKVLPFIPQVTTINTSTFVETLPDDPHFWLDPENDAKIADRIRDTLAQKDPANAAFYSQNTEMLKASFVNIDQLYRSQLASCALRDIVVSHDAYAYMAKKYGFTIHPIAGLSPDTEPNSQTIAQLINLVREKQIPYILFEELVSPKIAETIAKEAKVGTLMLSPIEGLTAEEERTGQNMIGIMENNLGVLKMAMKCK